jgi:4-amino-4-deoxy-L-arabinose transferase-like glycosyltransferase
MAEAKDSSLPPDPQIKNAHSWLPILLIASGFGLFRLLYAGLLNLSPQEAYYWVWSLHPELSYFDHPPMVAYSIKAFTFFLGNTVYAVRLPAVFYGMGTTLVVYSLADKFFGTRAGLLTAFLLNLVLGFSPPFLFTTPDSPLIFFWCLTLFWVWKAAEEKKGGYWLLAGVSWGLALLSKYTAALLGVSIFLWLVSARDLRREFKRMRLYGSVLAALVVFSPVVIWNSQNQWVSFFFQSRDRFAPVVSISLENIFTFIASQAGLMHPLLFVGFMAALYYGIRRWRNSTRKEERFLIAAGLVPLAFFALASTRVFIKVNWPTIAYPALLILLVGYYQKKIWLARWIRKVYVPAVWGLAVGVFVVVHVLLPWKAIPLSSSLDTLSGWPEAAARVHALKEELSSQKPAFIWAWDHKVAATLQFYLPPQDRVFCRNVIGLPALAYSFLGVPGELEGKDALLIWSTLDPLTTVGDEKARKVFTSLRRLESLDVYRGKQKIRTFFFAHCVNYQPQKIK